LGTRVLGRVGSISAGISLSWAGPGLSIIVAVNLGPKGGVILAGSCLRLARCIWTCKFKLQFLGKKKGHFKLKLHLKKKLTRLHFLCKIIFIDDTVRGGITYHKKYM
jgi:hypothetical protein